MRRPTHKRRGKSRRRTWLKVLGLLGALATPPGFLLGALETTAATGYQQAAGHLPHGWHRQAQRAARAWWAVKDYMAMRWEDSAPGLKRDRKR